MAGLYCSLGKKLYSRGSVVLQYTAVYCDRQWSKDEVVSRHGQARAQLGTATRRWVLRHDQARAQQGAATWHWARGARGKGARLGRAAGLWAVHLVHSACF